MLGLEMLDVVIGIIFVFLLLSLICSAINEMAEAYLKLRAVDLEQGIRELLNDYNGTTLTKKIYDHPLIYSLFRGTYDPSDIRTKSSPQENRYSRGSSLPSYIPARSFALALMDVLLPPKPATPANLSGAAGAIAADPNLQATNANNPQTTAASLNPLLPLRNSVSLIQNNEHVKDALLTIIDAAGEDAVKAREGIENWYNSAMDRVAGWYKRRVQKIIFVMGFAVAIIVNADTFAIFNNLANDRPLRSSIVAAAQSYKNPGTDTLNSNEKIKKDVKTLLDLGLPVGWYKKNKTNNEGINWPIPKGIGEDSNGWDIFFKIIGWLVTGIAISLGAPFWFDTLNKVMVVRSTVKPTEKSPDEASEDRQRKG